MPLIFQHLVNAHGNHILQVIKDLSEKLSLSLDGVATEQITPARNMSSILSSQRKLVAAGNPKKLSPAKYEAWKMWSEDGLSIQRIAV